jgi:hypothetical protein
MLLGAVGLVWYVVIPLCIILFCGLCFLGIGAYLGLEWLGKSLTCLAKALPDWRIFNEPAGGGLLRLCGQYWVPLMLGGFVVFSVLAHTLLPR